MANADNQQCANCIGALSFPIPTDGQMLSSSAASASAAAAAAALWTLADVDAKW